MIIASIVTSRRIINWVALGVSLALIGCHPGNPRIAEPESSSVVEIPSERRSDSDVIGTYQIVAGDQLQVRFQIPDWDDGKGFAISVGDKLGIRFVDAPELNQEQFVRPDGAISMPYIGQLKVSGLEVAALTNLLKKRYSDVLVDPELYVVVIEYGAGLRELRDELNRPSARGGRIVNVRPDGVARFPLIGEIRVSDRSVASVGQELNERIAARVRGLEAELAIYQHASRLVYVLGEVNQPGAYAIDRPLSAMQAISLAGGYKPSALLEEIVTVRRDGSRITAHRIDLLNPMQLDSQLFSLKADDVLWVPKSGLFATGEIAREVREILLFRGWGVNIDSIDL